MKVQKSKYSKNTDGKVNSQVDKELMLIKDIRNGRIFYLSLVDDFVMNRQEYVVAYNYLPDDGEYSKPELVIMRTEYSKRGAQYFESIKDKSELNRAFEYFMRRYSGQ